MSKKVNTESQPELAILTFDEALDLLAPYKDGRKTKVHSLRLTKQS